MPCPSRHLPILEYLSTVSDSNGRGGAGTGAAGARIGRVGNGGASRQRKLERKQAIRRASSHSTCHCNILADPPLSKELLVLLFSSQAPRYDSSKKSVDEGRRRKQETASEKVRK